MSGVVLAASAGAVAWLGTQETAGGELPEARASVVTAHVEVGSVATRVNVVSDVEPGEAVEVAAPEIVPSRQPVVTAAPRAGQPETEEGDVLVEVALRPVFVLDGGLTMFRQLGRGDEGSDVKSVQESLARLGYDAGAADGVLGARTLAALRSFYADRGYQMWTKDGVADSGSTPASELVVPMGELAFVRQLPLTSTPSCERVGTTIADQPACRLVVGESLLRASVPTDLAGDIQIGDEVMQASQSGAALYEVATLPQPAANTGPNAGGGSAVGDAPDEAVMQFDITPVGAASLPGGSDVPLVVITERTPADSLIVPAAAIRDLPGGAVVDVMQQQGTREVQVSVVLCVSGRCAVSTEAGGLAQGDEVLLHSANG